ncbi:MAG TPA: PAS domain S-box protein [Candidatus Wunengus sp. YC64]|uniref:PAS domain S-box protein n=1 Tax=Candidatus Wunengus sp. YC64 TaxID=3367700 RepID=UPI00402629B4
MKKLKLSLKEKAILGIIATLVPILTAFVLNYWQNRAYLKNYALNALTIIAEAYEGQVYQFLEMAKRRAHDFSSDGFIRTQLQRAIHGNTSAINKLNKHLVKNKLSVDKTINTINILSLEGRVVASTNNAEIGRDFSSETIFVQGKETVTMVEKCFGHCKLTEIAISAPILNKDTGRLIGVIINHIPIAELNNIVTGKYSHNLGALSWAKGKGAWKTLEIYLVNRDKRMITESVFVKDAVWNQVVDTLPIKEGLKSNKEITGFYRDYRGVGVAGASMYIPSMKWVLLVEIDKEEVLAPIRYVLINMLTTAAVVIVMIILLFVSFMKRMVKPLYKMSDAAKKIAGGNFDVSIPVQTSDEIGALCESFNYMSRHIKGRTTALEKSNTRLAESQRIAHIGNWEWDVIKDEVSWSYEAYRIFGLTQETFVSPFETFLNHVYPDDREFVKKSIDNALKNKKPLDIDHRILLKDLTVRIVHEGAAVVSDNLGKVVQMVGTVQDITERKRAEEEVSLFKTLTLAISEAKDLHDALVVTLEKVCGASGWVYGEAWIPDHEGKQLVRDHAFYSKVESLKRFSELSGAYTFPPGVGLPGRVWSRKQPVWVRDVTIDPNFPRAPIAKEVGLKAAIGFPVFSENEMVAVLVFYMLKALERDERLVGFVSSVVVQLGEVIKRKKAEEALRENEEKLRAILDNTPNVVYVKDIRNKYLFINKQYENLFHVKSEELQGKTDYDLWLKEMADAFVTNDRKVIEASTPLEFEEVASHDDGLHTYISVKFPLFDNNGCVYAVCGISTDITEHKRTDEKLEKYGILFSEINDLAYICDTKGNILFVNKACERLTGHKAEEVIGKPFAPLFDEENIKKAMDVYTRTLKGEYPQYELWFKDTGVLCEYKNIPLRDEKGTIIGVAGTARDITEHRRAEEERTKLREQLYHAQKLESIGTLAGGIAHDFNNILTAIIGYGNLLQTEVKEDGSARDFIQKILKSAERAANLTQGLLAFSRKQQSNPQPVSVNEIIKEVEGLLMRVMREDIKLTTTLADKSCMVMADTGQMEQVLMNLATNARDAMPAGGILSISTDIVEMGDEYIKAHRYGKIGRYVLISISDTGKGMDAITKEKIFEPFFTTKEVGKGTGLGLAIVYGIIKQHNGYIDVDSESGKGTAFRIHLPLIESEVEKQKPHIHVIQKGGTETVLIAEDEEDIRNLMKMVLEGNGYKVIEAADGLDAINKFKENMDKIHLLLFDVIMPNKSGKEAYYAINEIRPGIKVLFMSGYSKDIIQEDISGLHFTSKPVLPTELLKKVREALNT